MDNNEQKIGKEENCAKGIIGTTNQNAEGMQELTEEMSSTSINKNASEEIENNEQKSIKKRFGGWLPDCLDWFKRPELAQTSLPTSSYTFNRYCWPKLHGTVKPHKLRRLEFSDKQKWDYQGNVHFETILMKEYQHIEIPIADINPPEYIIGFEKIYFRFIDDTVLQFIRIILPLLNEVKLYFRSVKFDEDHPQIGPIKCLMEMLAPKINKLDIRELTSDLIGLFPNFISGLQSICMHLLDVEPEIDMDLALKWLTTPREDGKPKMLEIRFPPNDFRIDTKLIEFMVKLKEHVKEEFIRSTEPANFIILLHFNLPIPIQHWQFKIENEATKEMLELKLEMTDALFFLIRRKNDGETTTMDDLKKQFERKEETNIGIMF